MCRLFHPEYKPDPRFSQVKCLTLFVTHYPSLAELAVRLPKDMSCYHMAFVEQEDMETAEGGPDEADRERTAAETSAAGQQSSHAEAVAAVAPSAISFLYQLTPGLAQRSYGLNVARLAGYVLASAWVPC
jgi:DNA mismatch repair protein MSH3